MATENFVIKISEDGSRVVERNIERIGKSADKAEARVSALKGAIGALSLGTFASVASKLSGAWQQFSNAIKQVNDNASVAKRVQDELYKVSIKTGSQLEALSKLYAGVAGSAKELGVSQKEIVRFTEIVSKSLSASGVGAGEAAGSLLQMSQALAGGVVRAQEFNSILSGTPALMRAVANHVEGVDGSVGKLRKIMEDGKLTSKAFFEAMLKAGSEVDRAFANAPDTLSGAFNKLTSAASKFFGELDSKLGITRTIAGAMSALAENINAVAIGLAAAFSPSLLVVFATQLRLVFSLISAHPVGLLISAVAGAVAGIYAMRDSIKASSDGLTTLGHVINVVSSDISKLAQSVGDTFSGIGNFAKSAFTTITELIDRSSNGWFSSFRDFYLDVGNGWRGIAVAAGRNIDIIIGVWKGMIEVMIHGFKSIPENINQLMRKTANLVISGAESIANGFGKMINYVSNAAGAGDLVKPLELFRLEVKENYIAGKAGEFYDIFAKHVKAKGGAVESYVRDTFKRADVLARGTPHVAIKAGDDAAYSTPAGRYQPPVDSSAQAARKKASDAAQRALEAEAVAWQALLDRINPTAAAKREYAAAQAKLNEKLEIGSEVHQKYSTLLRAQYVDQIDPINAYTRAIDEQLETLKLYDDEQEIHSRYLQSVAQLRQQGVTVSEIENRQIKEKIKSLVEANKQYQLNNSLLQQSQAYQARSTADQFSASSRLASAGTGGYGRADSQALIAQTYGNQDFFDQNSGYQAQMDQAKRHYEQLEELRAKNMISEQFYSDAKIQLAQKENAARYQAANQFFGNLSTLQSSGIRELARIGKAAAITQATINTYEAATKAYAQGGPYLGPALAAAAIAAGTAQIAAIRNQQAAFMTGGSFTVGGSGGTDSQMVAFRASPGERVSVATPTQVRKGTGPGNDGDGHTSVTVTPKIVNVLDPSIAGDFLRTAEGEKLIVNVIQKNKTALGLN